MGQTGVSIVVRDIVFILGGLAVFFGLVLTASRFCAWCRKRWTERKERRNSTKNSLEAIDARLKLMDGLRQDARKDDAEQHEDIATKLDEIIATQIVIVSDLRLTVSATGAALDGLMQHDAGVNGPVKRWKERLESRIYEGIGEPRSPGKD